MDNSIQPVLPVGSGYGDGFGGGSGMWLFALLILFGLFNGGGFGWNGGNGNSNAIQNDINRGFDNQNLQAQTRDILTAVNNGTAQSVAATNATFHDNLAAMQSLYNETARDIAALAVGQANALANQNACCCETKQLIMQSNYENAMQMAAMENRLTSKMDSNTIQELRDQISALQLQSATSNVLRFPNAWTYYGGYFPPMQTTTTTAG